MIIPVTQFKIISNVFANWIFVLIAITHLCSVTTTVATVTGIRCASKSSPSGASRTSARSWRRCRRGSPRACSRSVTGLAVVMATAEKGAMKRVARRTAEMGNLVICDWRLIEANTLPITIGNWHYSRIRGIGNVVDSVTEPRKNNYFYFLYWHIKNTILYRVISNTEYNLISNTK